MFVNKTVCGVKFHVILQPFNICVSRCTCLKTIRSRLNIVLQINGDAVLSVCKVNGKTNVRPRTGNFNPMLSDLQLTYVLNNFSSTFCANRLFTDSFSLTFAITR